MDCGLQPTDSKYSQNDKQNDLTDGECCIWVMRNLPHVLESRGIQRKYNSNNTYKKGIT